MGPKGKNVEPQVGSMKMLFRIAVAIAIVIMVQTGHGLVPARAQEPEHVDTHRDWHTYTYQENGNLVCYMASKPTDEQGEYTQRGDVYLLVTHRPAEASRDVISVITGYTYGPESEAVVTIDEKLFNLFTSENTAWARDPATDAGLISAMKAGTSMMVKGTSTRGTETTDTYSLLGFTAAYNEISRSCGL